MNRIIQRHFKTQSGLTLIELLVAIALFSIVMALAFSMFFFNQNVFTRGEARSNVQYDVRMAADFITTELRNVHEITIDQSSEESIDLSTLQQRYQLLESVEFEIVKEQSRYLVRYKLVGNASNSPAYEIESKVLLNNIGANGSGVLGDISNSGTKIEYSKNK